jgi:hypothetical protein
MAPRYRFPGDDLPQVLKELERLEAQQAVQHREVLCPQRQEDCPAAPLCRELGNLRRGCLAQGRPEETACLAAVVLILATWSQALSPEVAEHLERRRIGFDAAPPCPAPPSGGGADAPRSARPPE